MRINKKMLMLAIIAVASTFQISNGMKIRKKILAQNTLALTSAQVDALSPKRKIELAKNLEDSIKLGLIGGDQISDAKARIDLLESVAASGSSAPISGVKRSAPAPASVPAPAIIPPITIVVRFNQVSGAQVIADAVEAVRDAGGDVEHGDAIEAAMKPVMEASVDALEDKAKTIGSLTVAINDIDERDTGVTADMKGAAIDSLPKL